MVSFTAKSNKINSLASRCLVVGVHAGKKVKLSASAQLLDNASKKGISAIIRKGDMSGEPGSTLMLYDLQGVRAERVMLVGLGAEGKVNAGDLRKAALAAAQLANKSKVRTLDISLFDRNHGRMDMATMARQVVESIAHGLYAYDETKSGRKKPAALKSVSLLVDRSALAQAKKGVSRGAAIGEGMNLARELGNLPGNICTPSYLARQAKNMQKELPIKTKVLSEADMRKLKMGSLLSVSRGSREPAKLIIMEYKGGKKGDAPVVLVGKGLTFDAGGISIKPAGGMDEMKFDMCGGASVFGAMHAIATMGLPLNVVGVVPSSENLPDGAANKPGDIVTSMAGKTIEILNTDAEGRLILCDALTYVERYKPAAVVDIATLTGACVVALGNHATGLFSNSEKLAKELLSAGETAGDRAWQLPVWDDYTKQLKSNFADLANIGGRNAGAVTAACFLKEFTQAYDWAHLDIAGTAWHSGGNKGSTGRPVPLLVEFLLNRAA
ncbi:MAG: leucyl aminopeptidase [Acidiferrobacterales bacterium]|nr:leucyl aminopeptidase [Acidiferrobacterales bacterium]